MGYSEGLPKAGFTGCTAGRYARKHNPWVNFADLPSSVNQPFTALPADWPASLYWTPVWSMLLDPQRPAVCFVYPDGRSSQSNPFEADAVAALAWLLHGRLARQPLPMLNLVHHGRQSAPSDSR